MTVTVPLWVVAVPMCLVAFGLTWVIVDSVMERADLHIRRWLWHRSGNTGEPPTKGEIDA